MKSRVLALILALGVISWAQTTTPVPQSDAPAAKCGCCQKMASADSKDGHASCMHKQDGKEMASCCAGKDEKSCCGGKDAKSCMRDGKADASCCKNGCGKDKTASCCGSKAGKQCGKGCCAGNKGEKTA